MSTRDGWTISIGGVDYSEHINSVRLEVAKAFAIPARLMEEPRKPAKILPFAPRRRTTGTF